MLARRSTRSMKLIARDTRNLVMLLLKVHSPKTRKQTSYEIVREAPRPADAELLSGRFQILLFANRHLMLSRVVTSWSSISQKDKQLNGGNSSI